MDDASLIPTRKVSWNAYSGGRPGCIHYPYDRPWDLRAWRWVGYRDITHYWLKCAMHWFGFSRRQLVIRRGRPYWLMLPL